MKVKGSRLEKGLGIASSQSRTSGQWARAGRFRCCDRKVKKGDLKKGAKEQGRKFSLVPSLVAKPQNGLRESPFA